MYHHSATSSSSSLLLIRPKCPSNLNEQTMHYYEQLKQSKISCDVILLPEIPTSAYSNGNANRYTNNHSSRNDDSYHDNNIITYHKHMNPCDVDTSWIVPFDGNYYGNNKYIASFSNCKANVLLVRSFSNNNIVSSAIPVEMNPSTFHFELSSTKEQPLRLEMSLEVIEWGPIGSHDYHQPQLSVQHYQHQDNPILKPSKILTDNKNNEAMKLQQMLEQETQNLYYILTVLGITLASVYLFATHKLLQQPKQKNNEKTSSSSSARSSYTKRTSATRRTSTGRKYSGMRSTASRRRSNKYNTPSTAFTSSPESNEDDNNCDYDSYSSFSYSTIMTSKGPATIGRNNRSICSKRSSRSRKSHYTNNTHRSKVPIHMIHLEKNGNMIKEEDEFCCSSGGECDQKIQPTKLFSTRTNTNQATYPHHMPLLQQQNQPKQIASYYNNASQFPQSDANAFSANTQCYNTIPTLFPTLSTTNGQPKTQLLDNMNNFHLGVNTTSTKHDFNKKQQSPFMLSQCNNSIYQRHQQMQYQSNTISATNTDQQMLQNNKYVQPVQPLSTPLPFKSKNDSNSDFTKNSLNTPTTNTAPLSPCSKLVHQFKITKSLRRKKFLLNQQKQEQQKLQDQADNNQDESKKKSNVITPDIIGQECETITKEKLKIVPEKHEKNNDNNFQCQEISQSGEATETIMKTTNPSLQTTASNNKMVTKENSLSSFNNPVSDPCVDLFNKDDTINTQSDEPKKEERHGDKLEEIMWNKGSSSTISFNDKEHLKPEKETTMKPSSNIVFVTKEKECNGKTKIAKSSSSITETYLKSIKNNKQCNVTRIEEKYTKKEKENNETINTKTSVHKPAMKII